MHFIDSSICVLPSLSTTTVFNDYFAILHYTHPTTHARTPLAVLHCSELISRGACWMQPRKPPSIPRNFAHSHPFAMATQQKVLPSSFFYLIREFMSRCLHFVRGLHTKGLLYVMHSPHFYSDSSAGCSGTSPLAHCCKSVGYIDGIGRYCFAKPYNCWLVSNNVCNIQFKCHQNYIKSTLKRIFPLYSNCC